MSVLSHHTVSTTINFLSIFAHHGICIVFSDTSMLKSVLCTCNVDYVIRFQK